MTSTTRNPRRGRRGNELSMAALESGGGSASRGGGQTLARLGKRDGVEKMEEWGYGTPRGQWWGSR